MRSCFVFWGLLCLPLFTVASQVKLHCWIVADDMGDSPHSYETISNQVVSVNRIYSQVAMSFTIESISHTNSTRLTNVVQRGLDCPKGSLSKPFPRPAKRASAFSASAPQGVHVTADHERAHQIRSRMQPGRGERYAD